jgi:hypothetical protein
MLLPPVELAVAETESALLSFLAVAATLRAI